VLLGAVYWFVFGLLFDRSADEFGGLPFVVYLLSGMFPFYFTQTAMTGGVNSIVNNTQLLANLHFPRAVLPIAALVEGFVGFLTSLFAFFIIVGPANGLVVGFDGAVWPTIDIVLLIPIMIIHLMFNLGLSMLVARLAVPFRDLNNLVPYLTRMWLYLSPILYGPATLAKAPDWARAIANSNPMAPLLRLYRHALTPLDTDLSLAFTQAGIWALALLVGGGLWFIRYEGRMARYL